MRLSIGAKLAVGFSIILIIGGWMGWRTYQMYSDLQTRYTELLQETYPLALAAQRLNVQVQTQAQMLMAYAVNREERAKTAVGEARQRAQEEMEFLQAAADRNAALSERVAAIMEKQQTFNTMVTAIFETGDQVNAMMLQQDADRARSVAQRMSQDVDNLVVDLQAEVESKRVETLAEAEAALRTLAILAAIALAICILVVCLVQVFIAQPVRRVARELQGIAGGAGDLTRRLSIRTGDELQDLADSFNQMQARLADMVRRVVAAAAQIAERSQEAQSGTRSVSQATAHVGDAMGQVAAGAQNQAVSATTAAETMQQLMEAIGQIAAGAQQQAVQVQGTTVTVGNMVRAMEGVARHSAQVTEAADLAAETARRGADIVDQTLAGMQRIRDKVMAAANRMENLDQHTKRIGEIMQVITDIADQTNLLALNAAIEAARAGEQGRGFAVVADEVRKLAERAAHSAKEIRILIKNIQSGMSEAVSATREGVKGVESGSELAASAGAALQEIRTTVERTTSGIQQISRAAQEVLGATQEVARSVEEVAAVTEENSAATEQMAAGASQVNDTITDVQRVCDSNSRAVEEVSASLQEVNSSMSAIAQLSDEMARVAATLQELVGQFCVDQDEAAAETEADQEPEPQEEEETKAADGE